MFITRVRVHLAVIAGLYLLSVAFGYQLDKYELVYSQAGVATGVVLHGRQRPVHGLRRPHVPVRARRRRCSSPARSPAGCGRSGLVVGVWFSASIVLGRLYPEAIQRFTVDPNQYAQEQPYIANNIAMTRLAFGLDQWETTDYTGTGPLTEAALRNEADTFANARLWDYRPLADDAGPAPDRAPVLRLRGRGHGPLHGQRHAAPGHALRPRAGDREEPARRPAGSTSGSSTRTASASRWSRSTR